jgi:hypothetical protein
MVTRDEGYEIDAERRSWWRFETEEEEKDNGKYEDRA